MKVIIQINLVPEGEESSTKKTEVLISNLEVVERLGVNRRTLYNWRVLGKLPFYKISQKVFFREKELRRFLEKKPGELLERLHKN